MSPESGATGRIFLYLVPILIPDEVKDTRFTAGGFYEDNLPGRGKAPSVFDGTLLSEIRGQGKIPS
jgi:hypothetical protein